MPSFDITSEVNKVELKNAIEQSQQGDRQPLRLQGLGRTHRAEPSSR